MMIDDYHRCVGCQRRSGRRCDALQAAVRFGKKKLEGRGGGASSLPALIGRTCPVRPNGAAGGLAPRAISATSVGCVHPGANAVTSGCWTWSAVRGGYRQPSAASFGRASGARWTQPRCDVLTWRYGAPLCSHAFELRTSPLRRICGDVNPGPWIIFSDLSDPSTSLL